MAREREKRHRKPDAGVLHIRQVPALSDEFRGWIAAQARHWDYYGQRIGQEGLVNSVIADFLARPPEAQAAILARGIPRAEEMERSWNREIDAQIAAGLIEPEWPYELTEKGKRLKGQPIAQPEPARAATMHHANDHVGGPRSKRKGA